MKAFPTGKTGDKNHDFYVSQDGMDLRDYFAGQIIVGFLANNKTDYSSKLIVKLAYELADAMMKERERNEP